MKIKIYPANSGIKGEIDLPSDKSISHRSLLIAAIAEGKTVINNFLVANDTLATLSAINQLGIKTNLCGDKLIVYGAGIFGLKPQNDFCNLDLGNSGTSMRLLCGFLSCRSFTSVLTGDASLNKRPMARVVTPLRLMGAHIDMTGENYAPITIHPNQHICAIDYRMPIDSAQVKSAVLLAGLYANKSTKIVEKNRTRDHTERLLKLFGADIKVKAHQITIMPTKVLHATTINIGNDFSAAAFFIVAALICDNSEIVLKDVNLNPLRTGLLVALSLMGANIRTENVVSVDAELRGTLIVTTSSLKAAHIPGNLSAHMIDEIPILAIAAATADGKTVINNVSELRYKESDRINSIMLNLRQLGISCEFKENSLIIYGGKIRSGEVVSYDDHRIAMSFAVAGLAATGPIVIDNTSSIHTSFPNFINIIKKFTKVDKII